MHSNIKLLSLKCLKLFFGGMTAVILFSCNSNAPSFYAEQYQKRSSKRGVSYGFQIIDDTKLLSPGVSWFYNWAPDISTTLDANVQSDSLDFFPMAWNGSFDSNRIRAYKQSHPNCNYILAFNEPNLTDQANMTPQQAAEKWPPLKALADELGMKIISPAMNYGTLASYSDPIVWLDEFFKLVPLSDVDGIAIHCYMSSPGAMASYVKRFYKYNKPLWMTEFCAWEKNITSVKSQMKFMSDAVNYLESDPKVAKYAWFIPRSSGSVDSYPFMQLLTKKHPYELSDLGKVYIHMSTMDKSTYYPVNQRIEAENYSSLDMEDAVKEGNFKTSIHLQPTTDIDGNLEVHDFYINQWVEYQIDIQKEKRYILNLRYASQFNTVCELSLNGNSLATILLENTGSDSIWNNYLSQISFPKGKHTLRIKVADGGMRLNWLKITEQ